jgi:acetate kinase
VRSKICIGLEHLGVRLDGAKNAVGEAIISSSASAVAVHVINTDEEVLIAREISRVLAQP